MSFQPERNKAEGNVGETTLRAVVTLLAVTQRRPLSWHTLSSAVPREGPWWGGAFAQAKPHPYTSPPKSPLGLSIAPSSQCSGHLQTPRGAPCPPCVFTCRVAGAGVTPGALPGYRGDGIGRQLPDLPRRLPGNLAASPQLGTSLPTFF